MRSNQKCFVHITTRINFREQVFTPHTDLHTSLRLSENQKRPQNANHLKIVPKTQSTIFCSKKFLDILWKLCLFVHVCTTRGGARVVWDGPVTYVGLHKAALFVCVYTYVFVLFVHLYNRSSVGWPRDLCGITQGSRAKDYQGSPYRATGATHKQRPLKWLHTYW